VACQPVDDLPAKLKALTENRLSKKSNDYPGLSPRIKAAIRLLTLGVPSEDVASHFRLKIETVNRAVCTASGKRYKEEQEALNREATAQLFAERAWAAVYGPAVKAPKRRVRGVRKPKATK